jgi:hypothetical protein
MRRPFERRDFLKAGACTLLGGFLGSRLSLAETALGPANLLLGPNTDASSGKEGLGIIDLAAGRVETIPTGVMGHSVIQRPGAPDTVMMFAQRPGRRSCEIDLMLGEKTRIIKARKGHHFYGHGAYSADGAYLYTTENNFKTEQGVIVIRDASSMQVLEEFQTHGDGPHELYFLEGGKTVVVANGGLKTSPKRMDGYKPYNRDNMKSSLVVLETASGKLLDRFALENKYLSIRHLSLSPRGTVAMAIQDREDTDTHSGGPLLCVRDSDGNVVQLQDDELYDRMTYHTLSISLFEEHSLVGATSPNGNLVTFWNIETGQPVKTFTTKEPTGLVLTADKRRFVVTTSEGEIHVLDAQTLEIEEMPLDLGRSGPWGSHLCSAMV